jgi:hypothetical protein
MRAFELNTGENAVLQHKAWSRRKTGIKPLLAVAFYTVLTVDKTFALK